MTETLHQKRNLSLVAIALFLSAYAAILGLVLAPKNTLTTPGSLIQPDD